MGNKQGESREYAATNNHKIVKSNAIFHTQTHYCPCPTGSNYLLAVYPALFNFVFMIEWIDHTEI